MFAGQMMSIEMSIIQAGYRAGSEVNRVGTARRGQGIISEVLLKKKEKKKKGKKKAARGRREGGFLYFSDKQGSQQKT